MKEKNSNNNKEKTRQRTTKYGKNVIKSNQHTIPEIRSIPLKSFKNYNSEISPKRMNERAKINKSTNEQTGDTTTTTTAKSKNKKKHHHHHQQQQ